MCPLSAELLSQVTFHWHQLNKIKVSVFFVVVFFKCKKCFFLHLIKHWGLSFQSLFLIWKTKALLFFWIRFYDATSYVTQPYFCSHVDSWRRGKVSGNSPKCFPSSRLNLLLLFLFFFKCDTVWWETFLQVWGINSHQKLPFDQFSKFLSGQVWALSSNDSSY